MTGAITWELVLAGLSVFGAVAGVVGWVLREFSKRDDRIAANKDELSDLKLHIAEHYATKDGVTQSLGKIDAALEKLRESIDRLTDRWMDRQ